MARIVATDCSEQALAVARQNAAQLDIANVDFACGNWLDAVPGGLFTLIVSNPPYVAENDPALKSLAYEPASALVSGDDGLDDIRTLATTCRHALVNEGRLVLEHGATQQEAVSGILLAAGWCDIQTVRDYAGLPRVTSAMWVDH